MAANYCQGAGLHIVLAMIAACGLCSLPYPPSVGSRHLSAIPPNPADSGLLSPTSTHLHVPMAIALRVLLLLTALARCGSFLVAPSPLVPGIAARPERASCRQARHRGPPCHLMSTSGSSPEDIDEVRQRLMASSSYDEMVGRIEGNSPFLEAGDRGSAKEGEESPILPVLRQTVRVVVDVAIGLVPVVLVVTYAKLPPPLLEALGSAATAIKGSPLEPVLEALPWEPVVVLKWAAQGGVAVLLSPVTDRLVVSPAIHQWVQAKLRSLSS